MKIRQGRWSISFKMALSLGSLIAFLMAALGLSNMFQLKTALEGEIADKGRYLTQVISYRMAGPLEKGDLGQLNKLINDFSHENSLKKVYVTDHAGKIVACTNPDQVGTILSGFEVPSSDVTINYKSGGWASQSFFQFNGKITTPDGRPVGYLMMVPGDGLLGDKIKDLVIYSGLVSLAAVLAGIFLAISISRRILKRPVEDLVAATETVATGDFSRKANIYNRDELGNLAMSFNMMIGYLSNLFNSITFYTGELVRSCQALNKNVTSSAKNAKKFAQSMGHHAGKTREHIALLQGCNDLAGDLVGRVEQTGLSLQQSAGEIAATVQGSGETGEIFDTLDSHVGQIYLSLGEMKKELASYRESLDDAGQMAQLFARYLDHSRNFNFQMAVEMVKIGGKDMASKLEEMQKLADEGLEKARELTGNLKNVGDAVHQLEKVLDHNIQMVSQGEQGIRETGQLWRQVTEKLMEDSAVMEQVMSHLAGNAKAGAELRETINYLIEELEKALVAFAGTGEVSEKQAVLLGEMESAMRKIQRVSNTLNNLCLQFKA